MQGSQGFQGNGSVTSVSMSVPSILNVSGSPVTTAGTFTLTLASQGGNTVFAGPNGLSGTPTFRSIVASDIPVLNQNTTGTATYATNISGGAAGGLPYQSGASSTSILGAGSSGQVLQSNGAAAPSWVNQSAITAGGLSNTLGVGYGGTGINVVGPSGNVLTSNGSVWVSQQPASGVPTGTVVAFAGTSAPAGWLLCDGNNTYSRTVYSALFAVIGTLYSAGNGSTTFGVPDLRGRAGIGAGTGAGLSPRSLASTVGTETVGLSTSEMPSHSHTATDGGHSHSTTVGFMSANQSHVHAGWHENDTLYITGIYSGSPPGAVRNAYGTAQGINKNTQAANVDHTHSVTVNTGYSSVTIGSAGSGTAHNNMQPSIALNYIIKT